MYTSADVLRRRRVATEALRVAPGQRLVDIGCGPGFYVAQLAATVGPAGHVTGVDPSDAMLAAAAARTAGLANVTLLSGEALSVPIEDGSVDGALSVQVLEYVPDVSDALLEVRRVLRPGGRVVLWDIDWSTLSWHATDPARMQRVLTAWDAHLAHPSLPQQLAGLMKKAGFADVMVTPHAFVNTTISPDAYSAVLLDLIVEFVVAHDVSAAEAAAWRDDLLSLDAAGDYFFSITMFCFAARRPA